MSYPSKILLLIPFVALAISCSKKKQKEPEEALICTPVEIDSTTCKSWSPAIGIATITGPVTANVGQTVSLTAEATATNGCGLLSEISGTITGNNIILTGRIYSEGCICTQALMDIPSVYSFTPTQTGTYVINAVTYEGNLVTHTIIVQ